ncbi:MAG: PilZ domain-containing protein [Armatimonadota bacterium]
MEHGPSKHPDHLASLADVAARLVRDGSRVEVAAVGAAGRCRTLRGYVRRFVPPDGLEVWFRNEGARARVRPADLSVIRVRDAVGKQFLEFEIACAAPRHAGDAVLVRLRAKARPVTQRQYVRAAVAREDATVNSVLSVATRPAPVRVLDISEGGMCIAVPVAALPHAGLQSGDTIVLLLSGEIVGRPGDDPFVCTAAIRRANQPVNGYVRMGVEYLNPSPQMTAAIARYVRARERDEIRTRASPR